MALILVVDDDAHVRGLVADTLAQDGHEVDMAQDGVDALYLLKRRSYDVIVSDLRMPMLDGPGLDRALQQRYAAALPRVIFITGYADAEPYTAFLALPRSRHRPGSASTRPCLPPPTTQDIGLPFNRPL